MKKGFLRKIARNNSLRRKSDSNLNKAAAKKSVELDGGAASHEGQKVILKGALSRSFIVSLNSRNMYLCRGKPKNNGPFLLTIAILVH